jgi:hypothetical protein
MVDNTMLGPCLSTSARPGRGHGALLRNENIFRIQRPDRRVALSRDPALMKKLRSKRNLFGNILQPTNAGCWTIAAYGRLRMNRASKNASVSPSSSRAIPR